MKYIFYLVVALFTATVCRAQGDYKEPSKESQAYHEYRQWVMEPSYGLKKVKALIAKVHMTGEEGEEDNNRLAPAVYNALSFREKYTYNMLHGDSYSQNCDASLPVQDEHKKIFGHLPDLFGEEGWSKRQEKFFNGNRDSVMKLMREDIVKTGRVGLNYKYAITLINAKEMIPLLIETYNKTKKDHDILTVLLLLMHDNDYMELLSSQTYKKLYSEGADYDAFLVFNTANEELIIKRATDFYNGLPH